MTFVVRDLERMSTIVTEILGGKEIYSSGADTFSISREKFFIVGGLWVAIMEGDPLPQRSYNHIAFKIEEADFDACAERVTSLGLDVRPARPRVEGEGRSLYFYDHDNHMFELHTGTLEQRLARYLQQREAAE